MNSYSVGVVTQKIDKYEVVTKKEDIIKLDLTKSEESKVKIESAYQLASEIAKFEIKNDLEI
jgi:hypothetical protein